MCLIILARPFYLWSFICCHDKDSKSRKCNDNARKYPHAFVLIKWASTISLALLLWANALVKSNGLTSNVITRINAIGIARAHRISIWDKRQQDSKSFLIVFLCLLKARSFYGLSVTRYCCERRTRLVWVFFCFNCHYRLWWFGHTFRLGQAQAHEYNHLCDNRIRTFRTISLRSCIGLEQLLHTD